jgi:hypothetical protein
MRPSKFKALFLVSFLYALGSCNTTTKIANGNFGQSPRINYPQSLASDSLTIFLNQLTNAHALADSIVKLVINDKRYYKFLTTEYGFTYPYWEKHLKDTLTGPAKEYKFYYGLLHDGDTIKSAIVSINSDMRINTCEIYELIAYKKFLNGKLSIGPKEALKEATAYGIKEKGVSMTFHASYYSLDKLADIQHVSTLYEKALIDSGKFFWEISNDCNGCVSLKVDAASGEVFDKGNIQYIY